MEPLVSFSGRIKDTSKQHCKSRLWQTFFKMSDGVKMMCHISDRDVEYSGTLFVYMTSGEHLVAQSVADGPEEVVEELILEIERQITLEQQAEIIEAASSSSKVLIVDDDPDSIAMMRQVLNKMNQPSVFVQDSHEAVAKLVRDHYKLVILDMMMPSLTGPQIVAYADAELDLQPGFLKKGKRHYVTFSGESEKGMTQQELAQFSYMGHWRKQQNYSELQEIVSKTLYDLKRKNDVLF